VGAHRGHARIARIARFVATVHALAPEWQPGQPKTSELAAWLESDEDVVDSPMAPGQELTTCFRRPRWTVSERVSGCLIGAYRLRSSVSRERHPGRCWMAAAGYRR
jgi:hypothetical protein